MFFRELSSPHCLSRAAILAGFVLLAASARAAPPDFSQADVRKSEPATELVKVAAISHGGRRMAGIPDINHLSSHSVLILDAASGETL
jgi:hypothetical protein